MLRIRVSQSSVAKAMSNLKKSDLAGKLKALDEALSVRGLKLRSYSGRGMFGKECAAVSYQNNVEFAAVCRIVSEVLGEEGEQVWDASRIEQMGKGYVVYFPSLRWVEPKEEAAA